MEKIELAKSIKLVSIHKKLNDVLDLDNIHTSTISELTNPKGENIGTRVILDFSKPDIEDYLNKWSSWKNAYKYRKR